ncbi:MAG: hypothetical protein IJ673_08130, partial [Treponema sp.]|nr:hypothetical protein [Treponema sp.]
GTHAVHIGHGELKGQMSSFHSAMAETSGSGVPPTKTLSHRGAVLPFLLAGSRWELVSATTVCINSTFDLKETFRRDNFLF